MIRVKIGKVPSSIHYRVDEYDSSTRFSVNSNGDLTITSRVGNTIAIYAAGNWNQVEKVLTD